MLSNRVTRAAKDRIALFLTIVVALIILVGSLNPIPVSLQVVGGDKVHHLLAYAALVLPISFVRPWAALRIGLVAIAFGAAIELVQPYVGRFAEFGDFLANTAGATFGVSVGFLLRLLLDRQSRNAADSSESG